MEYCVGVAMDDLDRSWRALSEAFSVSVATEDRSVTLSPQETVSYRSTNTLMVNRTNRALSRHLPSNRPSPILLPARGIGVQWPHWRAKPRPRNTLMRNPIGPSRRRSPRRRTSSWFRVGARSGHARCASSARVTIEPK